VAARLFDFARAAVAAFALLTGPRSVEVILGWQPVPLVAITEAQAPAQPSQPQGGPMNPGDQFSIIQWAVKEGGAFGVILVILFFYRRDWKTAVDFWRDQHAITTDLVVASTKAQTETSAALRENTMVVHSVKNVLARIGDRREP
jgi:hypothetical protein